MDTQTNTYHTTAGWQCVAGAGAMDTQTNIQHTLAELLAQRDSVEAAIQSHRKSVRDHLSAKWHAEAAEVGLSVTEVVGILGQIPCLPVAGKRPRRADKGPPSQSGWTRGVTYAHPSGAHDGTWVGGAKGRQPGWLREFIAGGRSWESLAVNPT